MKTLSILFLGLVLGLVFAPAAFPYFKSGDYVGGMCIVLAGFACGGLVVDLVNNWGTGEYKWL